LWVARLQERDRRFLPSLLGGAGPIVISSEELRLYGIQPEHIYRGVSWTQTYPANYVEQTLTQLPCAKEAGRAYWGRWICRDKLTCRSQEKKWYLSNNVANFVWGWLIVGRVRSRVWQASQHACHVYVDEVLVPHELPTGDDLGDWKLKETYNGIDVRRTGWYGTPAGSTVMQTGVAFSRRDYAQ